MDPKKIFDIAIIGAGPGGYTAAIVAAQKGKKVCLIEKNEIGGTCLNVGCIPTKCLLASAKNFEKLSHLSDFGIEIQEKKIDFDKVQKRKDDVVFSLRKNLEGLIKANKIEIFRGNASFISSSEIKVEGKDRFIIQADKIIIASGSEPLEIKKFPFDGKLVHSSTSILLLKTLPSEIAIVGGGYIGCEFASFFSSLGVKVRVIEAAPTILAGQEKEISNKLLEIFQKKGIDILTSTSLTEIEKKADHVILSLQGGKKIKADICLLAVGRKINTEGLNLEKAGVALDKEGKIIVDEKMQTNISNIYAIGDVTGKFMLAHVASHQGIVAAYNASGIKKIMHYEAIPSVIFTLPEIASVGLGVSSAKEKGFDASSSSFPLSFLGKSQTSKETEGFVSLVFDKTSHQILGAHMIGADASIMIAEMALAIANELTLECLLDTVHAHPTGSEAWLEAALLASQTPIHHPPIKK